MDTLSLRWNKAAESNRIEIWIKHVDFGVIPCKTIKVLKVDGLGTGTGADQDSQPAGPRGLHEEAE